HAEAPPRDERQAQPPPLREPEGPAEVDALVEEDRQRGERPQPRAEIERDERGPARPREGGRARGDDLAGKRSAGRGAHATSVLRCVAPARERQPLRAISTPASVRPASTIAAPTRWNHPVSVWPGTVPENTRMAGAHVATGNSASFRSLHERIQARA